MPGTLPILKNYSDPVLVSGWTVSPLSAAVSWTSQQTQPPPLSQRWWLEQDKESRCKTRSHSRKGAAEQENKKDGLQKCLYPKAMSVYSWAIRTLYSAPETTEYGHKFGGAVRLTQSQVWNSHCIETATTLQRSWCFTEGNKSYCCICGDTHPSSSGFSIFGLFSDQSLNTSLEFWVWTVYSWNITC